MLHANFQNLKLKRSKLPQVGAFVYLNLNNGEYTKINFGVVNNSFHTKFINFKIYWGILDNLNYYFRDLFPWSCKCQKQNAKNLKKSFVYETSSLENHLSNPSVNLSSWYWLTLLSNYIFTIAQLFLFYFVLHLHSERNSISMKMRETRK